MEELTIAIPGTEQVPTWTEFINNSRIKSVANSPKVLTIKFNNSGILKPYHIVSLACLIEEYYLSGAEIKFITNRNEVCTYLSSIEFFEYWKKGFDRRKFTKSKIKTTLSLWKINKEMISAYASEAQRYFTDNYFSDCDLAGINVCLAEIFNNIYDHAKSKVDGYVLTQFYPKEKQIIISVCDFGIGIPSSINDYFRKNRKSPVSDEKALELSFQKHFSTYTAPHNKGYGLDNLSSITRALFGEITIFSNRGILYQKKDFIKVRNIPENSFPGTCIIIILDTRYLPLLDNEQTIDEFRL